MLDVGESLLERLVGKQLENGTLNLFETLRQSGLCSFRTMMKVKVDKAKLVLEADRVLFPWVIAIAQTRSLDLKKVVEYELGPSPWSPATGDGALPRPKCLSCLNS